MTGRNPGSARFLSFHGARVGLHELPTRDRGLQNISTCDFHKSPSSKTANSYHSLALVF